ncbi:MAG: hypothetical protein L0H41_07055, partial [Microlunatus sp.]|nr:hypothetical protein [Microlunatus sp.]
MNPTPPSELDGFETSLLTELKSHVAKSAATNAANPRSAAVDVPGPTRPRRWFVGIAASVAAAMVAAILLVHALWPTPAFAVT